MKFKIKGHSGCDIKIETRNNKLIVVKSTKDYNYFQRLVKQANKQNDFSKLQFNDILTPEIYNIIKSDDCIDIEMELIYSQNFIEFFDYSSFNQLTKFTDKIINFIHKEISHCKYIVVNKSEITNKIQDIKINFSKNDLISNDESLTFHLNHVEKSLDLFDEIVLPIGLCHGDLTFSNILFSGNSIYLIDFLDSFLESPLMDIIKLRQDTSFYWSLNMIDDDFDSTRSKMLLNFFDEIIDNEFKKYDFYKNYYNLFQKINYLRILQYAKSEKIVNYIKPVLESLN